MFVDETNRNMALRDDSPAYDIEGFERIPFERIGILDLEKAVRPNPSDGKTDVAIYQSFYWGEALDAASRDARELKHIETERRASLMSYVAVIYVGMGIFLMIIVVLSAMLIPQLTSDQAYGIGGGQTTFIKESDVLPIYFWAAVIQSIGMGLVTGVFEDGNVIAGVKHIFVMTLITWVVFKLLVGF